MIGRMLMALAATCALLLGACGGDGNGDGASDNDAVIERAEEQSVDEQTVRQALLDGLPGAQEMEPDTIGFAPQGTGTVDADVNYSPCSVAIILIGADQIETYESAGDDIVKNADGTAGVKIITGQDVEAADCLRPAADVMEGLE